MPELAGELAREVTEAEAKYLHNLNFLLKNAMKHPDDPKWANLAAKINKEYGSKIAKLASTVDVTSGGKPISINIIGDFKKDDI